LMGGVESTKVTAGLAGFVVLFCLAIACWLLFRSMNKHLRKVRWAEEREEREAAENAPEAVPERIEQVPPAGEDGARDEATHPSAGEPEETRGEGDDPRANRGS